MRTARTTQLNCYGGNSTPQRPRIALEFVDLGAEYDYFAWVTTPYWNAMPGSTLGSMNAVAADVLGEIPAGGVLYQTLPATTYSGKLGSYGSWSNLRPLAWHGRAQVVVFRLQVWGTALEVAAQGNVIFDL